MRLTILGGCGAWPTADQGCSGYLVEHEGFRLLLDPGYATLPKLLGHVGVDQVDAVLISHGHPDHCADLNPLLRARALGHDRLPPLPVYTPPGAVDGILALDRPGMLEDSYRLTPLVDAGQLEIGPFVVESRLLPHWLPNLGVRLTAEGTVLAYTGDCGPCPGVVELARDADVLLAEATFVDRVPDDSRQFLTSARQAGQQAQQAGVGRLVLTHLWPGADPDAVRQAALHGYPGPLQVAVPDLEITFHGRARD